MNTQMSTRMSRLRALVGVFASGVLALGLTACSASSSEEEAEAEERSYEEVIDRYMVLSFEPNARQMVEELFPSGFSEAAEQEGEDLDEYIESSQNILEYSMDSYDAYYGEGWTYSYEIVSAETVEASREVSNAYKKYMDLELSELKEVQVSLTLTSTDGALTDSTYVTVYVAKFGNSWYIEPASESVE